MVRRRMFWFREVFGEMVPVRTDRLTGINVHLKHVLSVTTMRGLWGEWW